MDKSQKGRSWKVNSDENCSHESTVLLGSDGGNNRYYHCQECGEVVIIEGESDVENEIERMKREEEENKTPFDRFKERLIGS